MKNSKFNKFATSAIVESNGLYGGANNSDVTYTDSYNQNTGSYDRQWASLTDQKDTTTEEDKPLK